MSRILFDNVYDGSYAISSFFRAGKPTTAAIVVSLLTMSSKYDIPILRTEVIEHLESCIPTQLSQLRTCNIKDLFHENNPNDGSIGAFDLEESTFQLLAVALQTNISILLPMLYYECAILSNAKILLLSNKFLLESEVIIKLVVGREKLSKWSHFFGATALFPQVKCSCSACSETRSILFYEWINCRNYSPPQFPRRTIMRGFACIGTEELRGKICNACLKKAENFLAVHGKVFWAELPKIFGLGE